MIPLEAFLFNYLNSVTAITDLVADRIFPEGTPEGGYPCITFSQKSFDQIDSHGGYSGTAVSTYDLCVWSQNSTERTTLANAIWDALKDYKGTVNGVVVRKVGLLASSDLPKKSDAPELYGRLLVLEVWHS